MERRIFSNGITLFRSEFHVHEATILDAGAEPAGWVTLTFHLSGRSLYKADDGSRHWTGPGHGLIWRCDTPGRKIHVPGSQVVRHVGVAILARDLKPRLGADTPETVLPFIRPSIPRVVARTFETDQMLNDRLTAIHGETSSSAFSELSLEAHATALMTESLKRILPEKPCLADGLATWEADALTSLDRYLAETSDSHVDTGKLAASIGLSEKRMKTLFRQRTGTTIVEQLKAIRMRTAQQTLEHSDRPIKQVAADAGYSHVTNFSRAYTRWFGEPPAQTRRKSLALGEPMQSGMKV